MEHRAEQLAAVNGVEQLLSYVEWEPLLRPASSTTLLVLGMCPGTGGAVTPAVPSSVRAVLHSAHRRTLARTGQKCETFTG
jgi:hypothetical protein